MERQGAGLKSTFRYDPSDFNSRLGSGASNRLAMLRALAHLPFAVNSPSPTGGAPELQENPLGEAVFRAGLAGSIRFEGSKWP